MDGDRATNEPLVVGGRYELGALLGRGGMAAVHRALDRRLGRPVAVKRLSTALAADPTAQTRFQREAHAAASLNHPTVASVFDTGSDVDPTTGVSIPFLVMELVEGKTLRAVQTEGPRLTPERALEVTSQVLAALAHSHASGLVHRDIKPANVMLTPAGTVKVMDFGIARAADDTSSSLTGPAAVVGTAQYLSPEQARGEHVDARSDLYSTGCLLYELLVGRPPFTGESSVSLAYQHVNEHPVPLREVDPSLSPELEAVVMRALAKDPADRYASADQMRADVDRLLEQQRVRALPAVAAVGPAPAALEDDPTALIDAPTGALVRTVPAAAGATAPPPVAPAPVVLEPAAEPDPGPPPAPRRRRGLLVAVLVLALLVAGALALGLPRLLGADPRTVTVPGVVGQSRADADTALRNADLVPRFVNVVREDGSVDRVVGQTPAGGGTAPAGSTVEVEVNVGPDSARIPKGLVGMDDDDAEDKLKDAGFDEVSTTPAATQPAGAKKGEVLAVQPGEGELASLDQEVVLVVARAVPRGAGSSRPTSAPEPTGSEPTRQTPSASSAPSSSSEPSDEPSDEPSADPTPTGAGDPSGTTGAGSGSGGATQTPEAKGKNGKGSGKGSGKGKEAANGEQVARADAVDASGSDG